MVVIRVALLVAVAITIPFAAALSGPEAPAAEPAGCLKEDHARLFSTVAAPRNSFATDACCNLTNGVKCCNTFTERCCVSSEATKSTCCPAGNSCCMDNTNTSICCSTTATCCGHGCCDTVSGASVCTEGLCCAAGLNPCNGGCCKGECFFKQCVNTLGLKRNAFIGVVAGAAAFVLIMLCVCLFCCCCAGSKKHRRSSGGKRKSDYEMQQQQPLKSASMTSPRSPTVVVVNPTPSTASFSTLTVGAASATVAAPQSAPPQQLTQEDRENLLRALQAVQKAIAVALEGIATDRLTVDEGVTVMAVATVNALRTCPARNQEEFERNALIVFNFIDGMFREHLPNMPADTRENFVKIILNKMAELAQQAKKTRLEDSLETIKQALIIAWSGFMSSKLSLEEAQMLMGIAVAAALKNCTINTTDELRAHLDGFTTWMLMLADEFAPNVPRELKAQIVRDVWANVAKLF